ncbi:hypothetical protein IAU60_002281 [Kwoniella sp. DSM 27419]
MSPNRNRRPKSPSLGQSVFYPSSVPPPVRRTTKALPPYSSRPGSPNSPSPMYSTAGGPGLSTPPRKMSSSPEVITALDRYEMAGEYPIFAAGSAPHISPAGKLTHLFDGLSFATPQNLTQDTYGWLLYSAGSEPESDIATPTALPLSDLVNEALIEEEGYGSDSQTSPTTKLKSYNTSQEDAFPASDDAYSFPRTPLGGRLPPVDEFQLASPPHQLPSPELSFGARRQSWTSQGSRRISPPQLNMTVSRSSYLPPTSTLVEQVSTSLASIPASPISDLATGADYMFPSQQNYDDIFSPTYQLNSTAARLPIDPRLFTPPYTDTLLPTQSNALHIHPSLYPSAPLYPAAVVPTPAPIQAVPKPQQPKSEIAAHYLQNRALCPAFTRRYIIRDELGSGGFGFVCSAHQTGYKNQAGVEVAVKFIFKDRITECDYAMLEGEPVESYVLSRVHHPNIIGFKELYEDEEFFYLVQELHGDPWAPGHTLEVSDTIERVPPPMTAMVSQHPQPVPHINPPQTPGSAFVFSPVHSVDWSKLSPFDGCEPGKRPNMARRASYDLFECVEHQRFSEEQARKIFRQIVEAVSYLHKRGVYHRDLKDENIVIDRNLCVKIIDFGSAVIEDKSYPPVLYDHFRGTMSYAAAEVLNGRHYHAGPADIWSLGIILGIILTGESPFPNTAWAQEGRIKIKRQVPGGAFDLMQKCLCTDPRRRATIEQVERHPWLRGMLAHRGSIC